jgi:serine/threonine protein kinase
LQLFARKIIRLFGGVAQKSEIARTVENEVRAVRKLCAPGAHPNIVAVLRHGEVTDTAMFYFDMELCQGNLQKFIDHHHRTHTQIPISATITIMKHVSNGVAYIHNQGEVHRDLKPQNSFPLQRPELTVVVLYSRTDGVWKIADFGLTSEGASNGSFTTTAARGTQCYRAPELLREIHATYSNKVDVWAMGCIFYQLTAGRRPFDSDWAVKDYYLSKEPLSLPLEAFDNTVLSILHDTLERDPSNRVTAGEVYERLSILEMDVPKVTATSQHLITLSKTQGRENFVTLYNSSVCLIAHKELFGPDTSMFLLDAQDCTVHFVAKVLIDVRRIAIARNHHGDIILATTFTVNSSVTLWNALTSRKTDTFWYGSRSKITSLTLNGAGNQMALGTDDGKVFVHRISSSAKFDDDMFTFRLGSTGISSLAYHPDNVRLLSEHGGVITISDLVRKVHLYQLSVLLNPPFDYCSLHATQHDIYIRCHRQMLVVDSELGNTLARIPLVSRFRQHFAVSPCGRWIAEADVISETVLIKKIEKGIVKATHLSYFYSSCIWFCGQTCICVGLGRVCKIDCVSAFMFDDIMTN